MGVSLINEPALHAEHLVPIEDDITDLCAALDAISATKDHDFPARETVEDLSGEADVGQENHQRPPRTCPPTVRWTGIPLYYRAGRNRRYVYFNLYFVAFVVVVS